MCSVTIENLMLDTTKQVLTQLEQKFTEALDVYSDSVDEEIVLIKDLLEGLAQVERLLNPPVQQVVGNVAAPATQPQLLTEYTANVKQQKPVDNKPKFKFPDGSTVRGREHLMTANNAQPKEPETEDPWQAQQVQQLQQPATGNPTQPNIYNSGYKPDIHPVSAVPENVNTGSEQATSPRITRQQLQQPYPVPNARSFTEDQKVSDSQNEQLPVEVERTEQWSMSPEQFTVPDTIPNVDLIHQSMPAAPPVYPIEQVPQRMPQQMFSQPPFPNEMQIAQMLMADLSPRVQAVGISGNIPIPSGLESLIRFSISNGMM